jgi:hypothetical protein
MIGSASIAFTDRFLITKYQLRKEPKNGASRASPWFLQKIPACAKASARKHGLLHRRMKIYDLLWKKSEGNGGRTQWEYVQNDIVLLPILAIHFTPLSFSQISIDF